MYGYLHLGRVVSFDEASGGYYLQSVGLARTSRWGPASSAVPGLLVNDRVVLGATGTSRDNLVIIAKVGATFPGIADIPGLAAALAGKADDSEITAILAELTSLDSRLDTAESTISDHTSTLSSHAGTLATHTSDLTSLDTRADALESSDAIHLTRITSLETSRTIDRDLFGDALGNMTRSNVQNSIALTNGTLYLMRLFARRSFLATAIRMVSAVAGGAGGTGNIGLYTGPTVTALTLVRSGTINLAGIGRITHTLSSTYTISDGIHVVIGLLPLSYASAPQVGGRTGIVHSSMLNPANTLYTSVTKAGVASLPSTLDFTDGSWTATITSVPWVALA
jgi:hypothetical protein